MGEKLPYTPRSRVKNALRILFLRSRERAACLHNAGNTCQDCGRKASTAKGREFKVHVHHKAGVGNWEKLIDAVYQELLCSPDLMEALCPECHDKRHPPKTK